MPFSERHRVDIWLLVSRKENLETWRKEIARSVSRLEVGGFRPTGLLEASAFGRISLAFPSEEWPMWQGNPLLPLCQLNLRNASYLPDSLQDISLITIYIAEDFYKAEAISIRNRNDHAEGLWCLRTYETIDSLITVAPPQDVTSIRPYESRWRKAEIDYPTHDVMPIELPPDIDENYYDIEGIKGLHGTKLGGWPSCIQGAPWWDYRAEGAEFDYALQVDSEEKSGWAWGDGGAAYFARSKIDPNRWAFDWQCF